MWMLHALISLIFPSTCFVCKQEGHSLCQKCLRAKRRSLHRILPYLYSHFAYRDVAHILHAIKYFGRKDLIAPCVEATLADELREHIKTLTTPIIVPIPSPKLRTWIRGYNQSEEIAKIYAEKLSLSYLPCLRRHNTKRQVTLQTRSLRLKHHKSMYLPDSSLVSGRDIILVDDIATTGATLEEARACLTQAQARTVKAITLAH